VATVALHTVLKPGREAEYDALHRVIPADVAQVLRQHGVRDWRIWRDGQHVFHLVEVADYQAMRDSLRADPANLAWQAAVGPLFEVPDSYAGDDSGLGFLWSLADQLADPAAAPDED
jgi:L-rhamnose mutarotase